MKHAEFSIGHEFYMGDQKWRCTDVGTRVIVAISLSEHKNDLSWLNGPPYAVAETVIDENDFDACTPTLEG